MSDQTVDDDTCTIWRVKDEGQHRIGANIEWRTRYIPTVGNPSAEFVARRGEIAAPGLIACGPCDPDMFEYRPPSGAPFMRFMTLEEARAYAKDHP